MTLVAGPVAVYVDRGEGARLLGHVERLALVDAVPAAAGVMAAMSVEFVVAGEQAAKFLRAHFPSDLTVAVDAPPGEDGGRRNKSARKRNPKWRLR